jgi:hypothetical protein
MKVLAPDIFQTSLDGRTVEENLTIKHLVPVMGKASDMKIVVGVANSA